MVFPVDRSARETPTIHLVVDAVRLMAVVRRRVLLRPVRSLPAVLMVSTFESRARSW